MRLRVLAIDPGPSESAYMLFVDGISVDRFGKVSNENLRQLFGDSLCIDQVVCERIRSYGMPAGAELFETCEWCGRFQENAIGQGIRWSWLTRLEVKSHLCHSSRANDANIRQAIIDRFGGKDAAIGKKAKKGPLYGVSGDVWAALAVAVTWWDKNATGTGFTA